MKIRVLGSAAGGGFPQWNCGCPNCRAARDPNGPPTTPRTHEQVAVSGDGERWFLLNASPEIRAQIEATPELHPRAARHSPIAGIVLTNGDLDHCLGLLSLREWQRLCLYTTLAIHDGFFEGNAILKTLERFDGQLRFSPLELGARLPLVASDGAPTGLSIEAVPSPGKLPIHLESTHQPSAEDNVGLLIRDEAAQTTLAYFPGVGGATPEIEAAIRAADCVFFDGTFWSDDELIALDLADKRAAEMAHWPLGGDEGSLSWLSRFSDTRRLFIHVNNTNPMLIEDSRQAKEVSAAGVEVARDGMEIAL